MRLPGFTDAQLANLGEGSLVGKAKIIATRKTKDRRVAMVEKPKSKPAPKGRSGLETKFEGLWSVLGDRRFRMVDEHEFHPERNFRFDFAFVQQKVAVEIEGGIASGGRHVQVDGYLRDCDKYNEAQRLGWVVLRFTDIHLRKDRQVACVDLLLDVLRSR